MELVGFVFKRNEKILRELVTKTWQMESAKEKLEARKVSCIDTVKTHLTCDSVESCSGQWLQCAKEVLLLSGIDILKLVFSDSIFENHANDKYTWLGSEKVKVFLLSDFSWSKDLIP